jgi:putative transposase
MKLYSKNHCVYSLYLHLVFVTKYRKAVFTSAHLNTLRDIFISLSRELDLALEEMNGEKDHVHLLVRYHPQISISEMVNRLKGASSRKLRQEHIDLQKTYRKGGLWSNSYFAISCGGAPISIIKKYIQYQNSPSN